MHIDLERAVGLHTPRQTVGAYSELFLSTFGAPLVGGVSESDALALLSLFTNDPQSLMADLSQEGAPALYAVASACK